MTIEKKVTNEDQKDKASTLSRFCKQTLVGIAAAAALTLSACSSNDDAIQAANKAGWSNVQVTGSKYVLDFTCGEDEMAYKITGLNPARQQATATVCCGYTTLKGCTIRN